MSASWCDRTIVWVFWSWVDLLDLCMEGSAYVWFFCICDWPISVLLQQKVPVLHVNSQADLAYLVCSIWFLLPYLVPAAAWSVSCSCSSLTLLMAQRLLGTKEGSHESCPLLLSAKQLRIFRWHTRGQWPSVLLEEHTPLTWCSPSASLRQTE